MLNNKFITAGIVVVVVLAIIYIGNKVMTTTPQSGALGQVQYKIVPAWDAADVLAQSPNIDFNQAVENQLNKYSKDGWELIEMTSVAGGTVLVLKKN